MKNYIIFGCMGAGKSTLAEIIVKLTAEQGNQASIVSLGEDIKKVVKEHNYNNVDFRYCCQQVGQNFRDIFGEDIWNERAYKKILKQMKDTGSQIFIIDDGRQPNEFEYWHKKQFVTVGIFAHEHTRDKRLTVRDGYSQKEYFNFENEQTAKHIAYNCCQIQIENNGTLEELEMQARVLFR